MTRFLILVLAAFISPVFAENMQNLAENRYCPPIRRGANGGIHRSAGIVAAFKREHPCPSTGLSVGRCDGWQIDHVIPLASCGCDAVSNMQWLPVQIKTCKGEFCKDRWERSVYQCPETQP